MNLNKIFNDTFFAEHPRAIIQDMQPTACWNSDETNTVIF